MKAQAIIKAPVFTEGDAERIVYERILGHREVLNSHRWTEVHDRKCNLCNKQTYSIVVWNKKLSMSDEHREFFKHS